MPLEVLDAADNILSPPLDNQTAAAASRALYGNKLRKTTAVVQYSPAAAAAAHF